MLNNNRPLFWQCTLAAIWSFCRESISRRIDGAILREKKENVKKNDFPHLHYFMRYNQGMSGVDLLDCFVTQYRPTNQAKKWCHPVFLNYINMVCIAAWRLQVILQRDPQKDQLNFTRSILIGLLRNAVRLETARDL